MTNHRKRKPSYLTPEGKRAVVAVSGLLLAAIGAALASCHPDAVEQFCRGVLMRQMPRELQPGQRAPPCGPNGFKFEVSDGCWVEAKVRAAGDGTCPDGFADDPEKRGRCFGIMFAVKPGRGQALQPAAWAR